MSGIPEEKEWVEYLGSQNQWIPSQREYVILTPHPDDETLGAGGLIYDLVQHNIKVKIIAITDGENAYSNQPELRDIRIKEQENALQKLGISANNIIRLGIEDSAVTEHLENLFESLMPYVNKSSHLLAPWTGDYHPDHVATGRVAVKLAEYFKIPLSFYFFWTWHHRSLEDIKQLTVSIYPLSLETQRIKQAALALYHSQIESTDNLPILTTHYLQPAYRPFEVFYDYKTDFFESLYQKHEDPWRFETDHYELQRYERIFKLIKNYNHHFVFEAGCSIGILTQKLALISEFVEAIDISPTAIHIAQKRCEKYKNILIKCDSLDHYKLQIQPDLVIISEIGYYFKKEVLKGIIENLLEHSARPVALLASHWLGQSEDHILSANDVHEVINNIPGLLNKHRETNPGFRLDYWVLE